MERIDKILALNNGISRSDVKKLLKSGAVTLNGNTVTDPGFKIQPENADVAVHGVKINIIRKAYIVMNKPSGVISAGNDKNAKTVIDILPDELKRRGLFPAGRLDKDTVGLLIITDDGDFAHNILSPTKHVEKGYEVTLRYDITEAELKPLREGIILADGYKCKKARTDILEKRLVRIYISEGKYHQVKRMFAAIGNEVIKLKRISIGKFNLPSDLSEGQSRYMTDAEIDLVKY